MQFSVATMLSMGLLAIPSMASPTPQSWLAPIFSTCPGSSKPEMWCKSWSMRWNTCYDCITPEQGRGPNGKPKQQYLNYMVMCVESKSFMFADAKKKFPGQLVDPNNRFPELDFCKPASS